MVRGGVRGGGLAAAILLGLAGCAAPARLYVNPQADLSYYRKVAVLPFTNLSGYGLAGERLTRAFVTELIIADRFQVVEPSEFWTALEALGAEPDVEGRVDPQKLKDTAARIEATGVIRGAVTEYQMQRFGQEEFPVLSFDAELLDAATGNVVWRVSISKKGKGRIPLGGSSTRTLGSLTQRACAQAVARLRGRAL